MNTQTDPPSAGAAPGSNAPELTVSQLAGALKRTIEDAYGRVRVRGELGRVTIARSGHVYADLKDDKAIIATVMWKGNAAKLNFRPEEGLEVLVDGRLSTYPGRSQYQLLAEAMAPAGAGALMALLEERKKKLAAEGLFADDKKRPLPFLPEVIGVVTSPTGAVIRDILHRISDRFPRHVLVWPVLVQGQDAAPQVTAAIQGFNALGRTGPIPRPDILIVARGGGSVEDLWGFNDEAVVRAAAASKIPLISAVGHETDWTLIDLAADKRAPTPTGAAEMATPVRTELLAHVQTLAGRMTSGLTALVDRRRADWRAAARGLPRPEDVIGARAQRVDAAGAALRAALKGAADRQSIRFQRVAGRLRRALLIQDGVRKRDRLTEIAARAQRAVGRKVGDDRARLAALSAQLEAVSPKSVLSRGYALVRKADGGVVRGAAALNAGDGVALEFADGRRNAVIDGAKPTAKPKRRPGGKSGGGGDQGALF